jgi:plasmid stabilization system protein ParE
MPDKIFVTFAASALAEIGERFAGEIIHKIETLQTYPEMGRIVPEFDVVALRELIHPPFRIVYRYDENRVRIVRIWRSERLLKLS